MDSEAMKAAGITLGDAVRYQAARCEPIYSHPTPRTERGQRRRLRKIAAWKSGIPYKAKDYKK